MSGARPAGKFGSNRVAAAMAFTAASTLVLVSCGQQNTYVPPPPPKVTVSEPVRQAVTVYMELTGNTAAINSVDLEARVEGYLQKIQYVDGALVKKGAPLFQLQSDNYQAQLDQMKGTLASQQATLANAQSDYDRQSTLGKQAFASQANVEDSLTKLNTAKAEVTVAQANISLATITLGYTQVSAPFDGIVTRHLIDPGALVGLGGPTKLATIVQMDPIYTYFNVSEQQVLRIKQGLAARNRTIRDIHDVPVEIGLQTEEGYPHAGVIDYISPTLESSTGTLQVRGIFKNENLALLPGLFARVRVAVDKRPDAILVDDTAIGTNQLGSYVLVVGKDNLVEQRQVKTGPLEGQLRVIESGINADELVVVGGNQRAVPGNKVDPQHGAMAAAQPADQPAAPAQPQAAP